MIAESVEKRQRIKRLRNAEGIVAALAIDQRGTLQQSLAQAKHTTLDAVREDMVVFKACVTRVLGVYATATLLDVDFGMRAIAERDRSKGLLLAYEKWGYDQSRPGRMQETLADWSVARLVETGADWIKILLFYTPFESEDINRQKQNWVRRIGEECEANSVPFCLEPISYDVSGAGDKSPEFAERKPDAVTGYMQEFSKPEYHVDLLKVEIPVNMAFVQGARANAGHPVVYSKPAALDAYRRAADATPLPFIYLSAGVSHDVFLESLQLADEAGVEFNGVLCGRATWQEGIPVYAAQGAAGLTDWLESRGVDNIRALHDVLAETATPWAVA
jgi:tagatose 1,6-diphosphate aldolase